MQVVKQKADAQKSWPRDRRLCANTVSALPASPGPIGDAPAGPFDDRWLAEAGTLAPKHRNVFVEEMTRINDAIRREFFEGSIPFGDIIHAKSEKYDVDPSLVAAVIEQESRFHKNAISPVGARGLMQLMPRTGRWMGARDLYDAEQNIDAGVKYIKYLDKRFNGNLKNTIAAYNAAR